MGKIIKRGLGGLVALLIVAVGAVYFLSDRAIRVDHGAPTHGSR